MPQRRIACDRSMTPSPATLYVPGWSCTVARAQDLQPVVLVAQLDARVEAEHGRDDGSSKYADIGVDIPGPRKLANRSTVTIASGRRRAKPRT